MRETEEGRASAAVVERPKGRADGAEESECSLVQFLLLFRFSVSRLFTLSISPCRHELLDELSAMHEELDAARDREARQRERKALSLFAWPFEFCSPTAAAATPVRESGHRRFRAVSPSSPPTAQSPFSFSQRRDRSLSAYRGPTCTILVSFCSLARSSSSALPSSPRSAIRRSSSTAVVPRQTRMGIAILGSG